MEKLRVIDGLKTDSTKKDGVTNETKKTLLTAVGGEPILSFDKNPIHIELDKFFENAKQYQPEFEFDLPEEYGVPFGFVLFAIRKSNLSFKEKLALLFGLEENGLAINSTEIQQIIVCGTVNTCHKFEAKSTVSSAIVAKQDLQMEKMELDMIKDSIPEENYKERSKLIQEKFDGIVEEERQANAKLQEIKQNEEKIEKEWKKIVVVFAN